MATEAGKPPKLLAFVKCFNLEWCSTPNDEESGERMRSLNGSVQQSLLQNIMKYEYEEDGNEEARRRRRAFLRESERSFPF